ncbi:hypothetical protein ABIB99_006594 [Bradyrhizobium sp. LA6.1]|uniref:hypothetical protein n=1 Tax=Bradyrhizobium sp. LA6.1 TaxID=3156378 RepID=UPI003398F007
MPVHADQWGWSIGFYPGMEPDTGRRGIAATFEAAREAFEAAWSELRLTIPDSAFAESRPDRNWRARRWRQGACGELPAPRTHHRRAGGQRVLAEVSRQLMGWMACRADKPADPVKKPVVSGEILLFLLFEAQYGVDIFRRRSALVCPGRHHYPETRSAARRAALPALSTASSPTFSAAAFRIGYSLG